MLTGNLKTGSFRKFPTLVSYKNSTKFVRDFEAPDGTADSLSSYELVPMCG